MRLPERFEVEVVRDSTHTMILGRIGTAYYRPDRQDTMLGRDRVDYFDLDVPEQRKAFEALYAAVLKHYQKYVKPSAPPRSDIARKGCEAATVDALTEEYGSA